MLKDIVDVYKEHSGATFDNDRARRVVEYYQNFITKNQNHLDFFGGNLIGVYNIRFTGEDRDEWLYEICEIDNLDNLKEDLYSLMVPGSNPPRPVIDKTRNVEGNPLNYTYIYMAHGFLNSNIKPAYKERVLTSILSMMQAKYLTGLDTSWFTYRTDPAIAKSVYESLSNKSILKTQGSWSGVLEHRSHRFLDPKKSIHYATLEKMNKNEAVIYMVTDIQTRVRKSYRTLANRYFELHEEQRRVLSSTSIKMIDGEKSISEIKNQVASHRSRIADILLNRDDYLRGELLYFVGVMVKSDERHLDKAMTHMLKHAGKRGKRDVTYTAQSLVTYINDFIRTSDLPSKDIVTIAKALLSVIRSHKTKDKIVVDAKAFIDKTVRDSVNIRHEATLSSIKVAMLFYLVLRILTIPHFNR